MVGKVLSAQGIKKVLRMKLRTLEKKHRSLQKINEFFKKERGQFSGEHGAGARLTVGHYDV